MVHFLQDILKKQAKGGCAAGFPPTCPLGRAGEARPYECTEIFAVVNWWYHSKNHEKINGNLWKKSAVSRKQKE